MSNNYWEQLLKAEDDYEKQIQDARKKAAEIRDQKSKEAIQKQQKLKEDYQKEIEDKKVAAAKEIESLKKSLAADQKAKSKAAADEIRVNKGVVVDLLLKPFSMFNYNEYYIASYSFFNQLLKSLQNSSFQNLLLLAIF